MICHIVMFKFRENTSKENMASAKCQIQALADYIPQIISMEVGINFAKEARAMDMSLICKLSTKEDLAIYANHPEHLKVIEYIKTIAEYSKVVDYEI